MIQAETLGNPWDILNAILGHKYYQNHLDRVIIIRSSEWSEHLQQKWLIQSVNGRVLSTIDSFADISTREACTITQSEIRSRSNVWKELSVANFGFIHFVWPCLDDSDICDLSQVIIGVLNVPGICDRLFGCYLEFVSSSSCEFLLSLAMH